MMVLYSLLLEFLKLVLLSEIKVWKTKVSWIYVYPQHTSRTQAIRSEMQGMRPETWNVSENIKFEGWAQYLHRGNAEKEILAVRGKRRREAGSDKTQLYSYTIPPKYLNI